MREAIDRFLEKVAVPVDGLGCWTWIGAVHGSRQKRGHFWFNGQRWDAARWMWAHKHPLTVDQMAGKVIMHRCDNPLCVNPDHILLGSQADNVADMHAKGRSHHQTDPSVQRRAHAAATATMARSPELRPRGERHGMAKLSDLQRAEIEASQEATASLVQKYGISRSRVQRIRAAALRARLAALSGEEG